MYVSLAYWGYPFLRLQVSESAIEPHFSAQTQTNACIKTKSFCSKMINAAAKLATFCSKIRISSNLLFIVSSQYTLKRKITFSSKNWSWLRWETMKRRGSLPGKQIATKNRTLTYERMIQQLKSIKQLKFILIYQLIVIEKENVLLQEFKKGKR